VNKSSWMWIVALPCLLGVLFMQCGPVGAKCTATSCSTGCCDAVLGCVAGTAPTACGKAGATCSACGVGSMCSQQACTALSDFIFNTCANG
jgi:hypothetical protein